MAIARVRPGSAYRYYFKSVAVGDGARDRRKVPLPVGQELAGVPAGEWTGRGAPLLGLSGEVTEAEMEALFGQGLHPHLEILAPGALEDEAPAVRLGRAFIRPTYDDDQDHDQEPGEPDAVVPDEDGKTRSARRRKMKRGPVAAFDLVLRPPASVSLLRALGDDATVAVIDASQDAAAADVLAWLEDEAVVVYSGPGGIRWERPVGGLVVARFRHHDSRHRMPLLHDHLVVSVKVLRADGKWGHLDSRTLYENVVTAGALYNQRVLEEVCDRLGLATEARTPTPGLRPVIEIAGVPPELIDWTATRQRDTAVLLEQAEAQYTADHGYPPTARVRSRLMKRAADDSRPAKKVPLPLAELRRRWRADAIRRFDAAVVDGLLALCRRAAAAIRAAWPTPAGTEPGGVDVELAAVDVAATVYIHREHFRRRHLLAEARRHLARELRGRRAAHGLESRIVDAAIGAHCVDVTAPPVAGRRPRPPGHTAYTATWHPPLSAGRDRPEPVEDAVPQLSLHARAVATSISLQALVRASRTPAGEVQGARAAPAAKPSPQDQATAAAVYEQMQFADPADDDQEDQEQQLALSPERLAWLEELQRRIGDLTRETPKPKPSEPRAETATPPPDPATGHAAEPLVPWPMPTRPGRRRGAERRPEHRSGAVWQPVRAATQGEMAVPGGRQVRCARETAAGGIAPSRAAAPCWGTVRGSGDTRRCSPWSVTTRAAARKVMAAAVYRALRTRSRSRLLSRCSAAVAESRPSARQPTSTASPSVRSHNPTASADQVSNPACSSVLSTTSRKSPEPLIQSTLALLFARGTSPAAELHRRFTIPPLLKPPKSVPFDSCHPRNRTSGMKTGTYLTLSVIL
jgi:conjugative relaxase-like TrwC/TraI family protein